MRLYRLAGTVIRSELPLDEYATATDAGRVALTLRMRSSALPADFAQDTIVNEHVVAGQPVLSVARTHDGLCLRLHGYADYLIAGDRVQCIPLPGSEASELAQLFVHRVLPNALSRPTTPVFHASAVALDARGAMFLGDPGAGKSTLASALVGPATWLADDHTLVALSEDGIWIPPGSPFARLRADSLAAIGNLPQAVPVLNEKWRLTRPAAENAAQLTAMFALGHDEPLRLEPMTQRDAVAELAQHLFRIDPSDRSALLGELATLEHIASEVPMFVLHYPRVFDQVASVRDAVFAQLRAGAQ